MLAASRHGHKPPIARCTKLQGIEQPAGYLAGPATLVSVILHALLANMFMTRTTSVRQLRPDLDVRNKALPSNLAVTDSVDTGTSDDSPLPVSAPVNLDARPCIV